MDLTHNNITNNNVDYTSIPSILGEGTALKFNGSNSTIGIDHLKESINNEDFTVSFWVYEQIRLSNNAITSFFYSRTSSNGFQLSSYNYREWFDVGLQIENSIRNVNVTELNCDQFDNLPTPLHVAIVRKNNILMAFFNGVLYHSEELIGTWYDVASYCIIGYYRAGNGINEYSKMTIDDMCIIKGRALWTENFTPPTTYLPDNILNF